jgi:multiple sugar transport system permease protein
MAVKDQTSAVVAAQPAVAKPGRRASTKAQQQLRWGLFFISPWLIGFLVFQLLPIVATLALSFTNYNPVQPENVRWIGGQNYVTMLTDSAVWKSLQVTMTYALIAIPASFIFGLLLASLVNSVFLVGTSGFRTLFYSTSMIPIVAAGVIWAGVANTQTGWINLFLSALGVQNPPDWLNSTVWIYPLLVMIGFWGLGNLMLTLLAGMQGVPTETYEASMIDGAGGFRRFRSITIPLITPVIFYNLTLMVIGAFKYFDLAYVLKDGTGGPENATLFYALNFYKNSFVYNLMGYGSALAWVLFLITLAFTAILFWSQKRWVYYAGEGRK